MTGKTKDEAAAAFFPVPPAGELVHAGARAHPDRVALLDADHGASFTYAEFARRIDVALAMLRGFGLAPGDRIAHLGRNNDGYHALLFAAIRGGFTMTALNWRSVAGDIAFFLADSGALLVFCDDEFRPVLDAALADIADPPRIIAMEGDASKPGLRQLLDAARHADASSIAEGAAPPALLLYTSGTTGRPKGVAISAPALTRLREIEFAAAGFPGGEDETYLIAVPSFHIGGMTLAMIALARHATIILSADSTPANMIALCRGHKVTITWMVPTMIRDFVDAVAASGTALPCLHTLMYGGAPMAPELLLRAIAQLRCRFSNAYGMTEIAGSCTLLPPSDHDPASPLIRSIGRAMPGMAIEIRDRDGRALPVREPGEIWIRSPTLMEGYWNRPDATGQAVVDGWYRSGDGAWMDENGYLFLTDRVQDMIVSGAENVYPIEVENVVRLFPGVLEVAVVGLPDPRWGEAVTAIVETADGRPLDASAMIAFARARLAAYKCPKRVVFVARLPRTASGKVQRKKARLEVTERAGA